jgi:hypothetical protein
MKFERYQNLSGDSGVTRYTIGIDFIGVQFRDPVVYIYDNVGPGREHVERMKALARAGRALATYINLYVRKRYARIVRP